MPSYFSVNYTRSAEGPRANPIPLSGQVGIESVNKRFKREGNEIASLDILKMKIMTRMTELKCPGGFAVGQ